MILVMRHQTLKTLETDLMAELQGKKKDSF